MVKKNRLSVNFYTIENVNGGREVGGQKKPNLVNAVCERPLTTLTSAAESNKKLVN